MPVHIMNNAYDLNALDVVVVDEIVCGKIVEYISATVVIPFPRVAHQYYLIRVCHNEWTGINNVVLAPVLEVLPYPQPSAFPCSKVISAWSTQCQFPSNPTSLREAIHDTNGRVQFAGNEAFDDYSVPPGSSGDDSIGHCTDPNNTKRWYRAFKGVIPPAEFVNGVWFRLVGGRGAADGWGICQGNVATGNDMADGGSLSGRLSFERQVHNVGQPGQRVVNGYVRLPIVPGAKQQSVAFATKYRFVWHCDGYEWRHQRSVYQGT